MKKTAVLLAVLFCVCHAAFARGIAPLPKGGALLKSGQPSEIAVCVTGSLNESEKTILGSWILNALVRSGRFAATERASAFATEVGRAQVTQTDGVVDDTHISRIGKQFGIRYVCIAGVASYSDYYSVSARILDTETAKVTTFGRAYGQLNSMQALEARSIDVVIEMGIGGYQPQTPAASAAPPSPPPASAPPVAAAPSSPPASAPLVAAAPSSPPTSAPPITAAPLSPPVSAAYVSPPSPPAAAPAQTAEVQPSPAEVDAEPPLPLETVGASVIIHSKPPEAEVYIGERFIGKTNQPDKLLVPIGTYELKFVKNDVEKTETMTFIPGENSMKVVVLDDGKNKKSKSKTK